MNKNECSVMQTEVTKMLVILLKTSVELILSALLIYGFIHEKEVIKFEQRLKRIIVVNYRRHKNKKHKQNAQQVRRLRVINGRKNTQSKALHGSFDVA